MGIETKSVKFDMTTRGGRKGLEKLLAEGWTVAEKQEKKLLEWGRKTVFVLTRG